MGWTGEAREEEARAAKVEDAEVEAAKAKVASVDRQRTDASTKLQTLIDFKGSQAQLREDPVLDALVLFGALSPPAL